MSKSKMQAIKKFIETCPLLENGKINVDYLKDDINSYSIDQTPNTPDILKFVNDNGGKHQISFDFTVQAPLSSRAIDNLANSKFCEDFQAWIKKQEDMNNLPEIEGAFSIKCTTPGYILGKTENTAVYIMQMVFVYYD